MPLLPEKALSHTLLDVVFLSPPTQLSCRTKGLFCNLKFHRAVHPIDFQERIANLSSVVLYDYALSFRSLALDFVNEASSADDAGVNSK